MTIVPGGISASHSSGIVVVSPGGVAKKYDIFGPTQGALRTISATAYCEAFGMAAQKPVSSDRKAETAPAVVVVVAVTACIMM